MAPMMAPIQWRRRENNRLHVDQIGRNLRKTAIQFNADDSASAVISTEAAIDAAVNEGHSCGLGATSSGQFQIQPAALFTEIFLESAASLMKSRLVPGRFTAQMNQLCSNEYFGKIRRL